MEQGYVTFNSPMILITGIEDFGHHFSKGQKENLAANGAYLEKMRYGNDTPDELKSKKLPFFGKYDDDEEGGYAYLVHIEGSEVLLEETMKRGPYEESHTIPDHLFEIE